MKKKTLLNAIIITLLIIMGASIITSAFMTGKDIGFLAIEFISFVYAIMLKGDIKNG